jgi:heme/copper-type cytochrome/quinol oxidase subunit 3
VKVKHQPEFLGSVQEQSESLPGSVEDLSTFFLLTSSLAFLAAMAACTQESSKSTQTQNLNNILSIFVSSFCQNIQWFI